ncbi:zinc ABC transporter ATP-binding protein AztA [Streptomyces sp. NPDC020875]|uniref:zinc ABC transporter ATP-binding protein AztA n=1 Tax=Streptomyces sp. NPDC020875 TaxID=3154898 RepID=UPI003409D08C
MTIMFNNTPHGPSGEERRSPRIRLADVTAGYPGRPVLRQLDLEIAPLAMTALVGPNGSGKSTLLGVLAGVIPATSGRIRHSTRSRPAFVPQRAAVGDALPLTVRRTVEMGRWGELGLWRRATRHDRAAVDSAMERLSIADLAARQLGELSGGQRQRALIAQGLAQESDLLLLDEPTTGLDPEAREGIATLLAELVADGTTVVQATHDLDAARSADVCLLLGDGRLIGQGAPAAVLTAASLARTWRPTRDG